jgi:uncharacterized protein YjiS (DUF1127 family)
MTITALRPMPGRWSAFTNDRRQAKGGMFYRWYVRRERISELKRLLALEDKLLTDLGLDRDAVEAEIEALLRSPA